MLGLYTLHTHFFFLLHKSNTDKTRTPKQCTIPTITAVGLHHTGALIN